MEKQGNAYITIFVEEGDVTLLRLTFYNIVIIIERIEQGIRASRISEPTKKKGFTGRKKDVEVSNVEGEYKVKRNYQS